MMKKSRLLLPLLLLLGFAINAQNMQMLLSDANGNGWTPLSTTPHSVTLLEKSAIYPLLNSKISTTKFKAFKLMFQKAPEGVKVYISGSDKSFNRISRLVDIKLVGPHMIYSFDGFNSVEKIGLYYTGNKANNSTQIHILNFTLITSTGTEIATLLPTNTDAQKNITNWVRLMGYSGSIVFNGSYNREIEWCPAGFNKYNELTIKFKKPVLPGIKLRINTAKNGTISNEIIDIPFKSEIFTLNLKKNIKLAGCSLIKMSLMANFKGSKLDINNIYLTE